MNYQTITYNGIDLLIGFKVDGKYYAATMYDPAEYPEIEILEISLKDVNVMDLFLDSQIEEMYNILNETL
jgi:hypothetical protein